MSKKYKDGSKYLISMIQHIARIQEYLQSTSEGDYLKQGQQYDGINKQVDLLGEQVSKLIDTKADNLFSNFRDAVPWVEIRALRNRIAHESVLGRCEIARPRREKRQQLSVRASP